MAYTKQTWTDGETTLSAEHMNHIEAGVKDASDKLGDNTLTYTNGYFYITSPDGTKTKKLGSSEGTATTAQVLSGATFNSKNTSDSDDYSTGTMSNYSSNVQTIVADGTNGTVEYDIADGYHTKMKVNQTTTYNAGYTSGYNAGFPSSFTTILDGNFLKTKSFTATVGKLYSVLISYREGYTPTISGATILSTTGGNQASGSYLKKMYIIKATSTTVTLDCGYSDTPYGGSEMLAVAIG